MTIDWTPLRRVLRDYRATHGDLPLWWRDDDAIAPTHALDRLDRLSVALGVPVHVAVIPDLAHATLAGRLAATDQLVPLAHGWRHHNTAPPGARKAEFGAQHPAAPAQIAAAMERMQRLFQDRFLPVFVPPWNRMDAGYAPALTAAGFRGLSMFTPRPARHAAPGLVRINTHVDPIDWRGTRDLKDADQIIAETVANLTQRLRGETDMSEPFGYLTHHLVHTPALWDFTERYLGELRAGGAVAQPLAPLLETPHEPT